MRHAPDALLALAMGVQNTAARRIAGCDVRTTFVTGMIVAAVDEAVSTFVDRSRGHRRASQLHARVWLAFFFGAFLGAPALLGPIALLAAIAAADLRIGSVGEDVDRVR